MFKVRVIISGKYAFTPDTKEERDNSVVLDFNEDEADKLISGFGIDISARTICLN